MSLHEREDVARRVHELFSGAPRPFRFRTADAHRRFPFLGAIVQFDETQLHEARGEAGEHLEAVGAALDRKAVATVEIGAVRQCKEIDHSLTAFGIRNEHNSTSGRAFCKGSAKAPEEG